MTLLVKAAALASGGLTIKKARRVQSESRNRADARVTRQPGGGFVTQTRIFVFCNSISQGSSIKPLGVSKDRAIGQESETG